MGYRSEDDAARFSHELDALEFLALDRPVWNETWSLGTRLKRVGLTKGFPDILIAATAIYHNAILLHADSDFEAIAQHSDLRTESYLDAA
jgi:predicted nucleic acid-binding protein